MKTGPRVPLPSGSFSRHGVKPMNLHAKKFPCDAAGLGTTLRTTASQVSKFQSIKETMRKLEMFYYEC